MQIKIVYWFSIVKGGDTVVVNEVVVLGGRALNKDAKTEALKMIGQLSNLCQRHSSRASFNSKTD